MKDNFLTKLFFEKEKEIQNLIKRNFKYLFKDYEFVCEEFSLKNLNKKTELRVDLIGYNPKFNEALLIEIKNSKFQNADIQVNRYKDFMEFYIFNKEKLFNIIRDKYQNLKSDKTDSFTFKTVVVSDIYENPLVANILADKLKINLFTIKKYSFNNDILYAFKEIGKKNISNKNKKEIILKSDKERKRFYENNPLLLKLDFILNKFEVIKRKTH